MARDKVIVLGAGRPFRGVDPSALTPTPQHRRALDWLLDAFKCLGEPEIHFVGGYRLDEIIERYPNLLFHFNSEWRTTSSTGSLFVAPLDPEVRTYVCYADIVFRDDVVRAVAACNSDMVVAVDARWKARFDGRPEADLAQTEKVKLNGEQVEYVGPDLPIEAANAEFIGLIKLEPLAVAALAALKEECTEDVRQAHLWMPVTSLIKAGLRAKAVDVGEGWAELNAPQDLARFVLGTKAETLGRLRPLVKKSVIDDQISFLVEAWQIDHAALVASIADRFRGRPVIVRSSARSEDCWQGSNAGSFDSVPHVPSNNPQWLSEAIDRVIQSYGDCNSANQVLVQEMLVDVRLSGVVLGRTLTSAAPYYVINFDETAGRTDGVTGGTGRQLRTVLMLRSAAKDAVAGETGLLPVIEAMQELESLIGHDSLDVEFAQGMDGQIHVLQVRPLAAFDAAGAGAGDGEIELALADARNFFGEKQRPIPYVVGDCAMFGVMPDWNPAEIIGTKPRPLALSLYQYLVTDDVWATQRAAYGYRDVRPHPLLVSFVGHPYVDVRASLNSFVPAALSDLLSAKLVNHYLAYLAENPQLHDKIEFDVAFTCLTFDFEERARPRLGAAGFSAEDISLLADALRGITANAVGRVAHDLGQVETLKTRYRTVVEADMPPLRRALMMLHDCRIWGTPPFAHVARSAFVAMALLRSLESLGVLRQGRIQEMLASLRTVTRQFEIDGSRVAAGEMAWQEFVDIYGHLRPGTYDIMSRRYADNPEMYLRPMVRPGAVVGQDKFEWSPEEARQIARLATRDGLPLGAEELASFCRTAISGREYAKFVFSRNISQALADIEAFGRQYHLTLHDLSFLTVADLVCADSGGAGGSLSAWLRARADTGEDSHRVCQAVELPHLLLRPDEFSLFERAGTQPNFVTQAHAVGSVARVEGIVGPSALAGRIAVIEAADPGYDWLFGYDIAGLVTCYGGANSHMAIRAAELGLPAAIGVGELLFEQVLRAEVVELDCAGRKLRVIR